MGVTFWFTVDASHQPTALSVTALVIKHEGKSNTLSERTLDITKQTQNS